MLTTNISERCARKNVLKKKDGKIARLVRRTEANAHLAKTTNIKEKHAAKNAKIARKDCVI